MKSKLLRVLISGFAVAVAATLAAQVTGFFLGPSIAGLAVFASLYVAIGVLAAYFTYKMLNANFIKPLDSFALRLKGIFNAAEAFSLDDSISFIDKASVSIKEEMEGLKTRLISLQRFNESLGKAITTNDLIKNISEALKSLPYLEAGLVLLINRDKTTANIYPLFPKDIAQKKEFNFIQKGYSLADLKIESPVISEDLAAKAGPNELEAIFKEKAYVKALTVPVRDNGAFLGLLCVATRLASPLDKDLKFIECLALLSGIKLAAMQMSLELDQKKQEISEIKSTGKEQIASQISEMKATYSQVVQQGKMASMGLLSAGIAHELNNPIGGILGYTQLILSKLKSPEITKEKIDSVIKYLELMERDSKRCQWIVSNLLNFARKPLDERLPLDIRDVINNTIGIMEYQLNKVNVRVNVTSSDENINKITGNANELQQVFTNLIQNAADAMPESGGEIFITVKNRAATYGSFGDYVEVRVQDTGAGIPKENLGKIFDPFFTSKLGKSGTGLGLSITYTIVSSHAGTIKVESEEGKGTAFILTFPATKETTV